MPIYISQRHACRTRFMAFCFASSPGAGNHQLTGRLTAWPTDWLTGWPIISNLPTDRLTGCPLAHSLTHTPTGWLWLTLTGWPTGFLAGCYITYFTLRNACILLYMAWRLTDWVLGSLVLVSYYPAYGQQPLNWSQVNFNNIQLRQVCLYTDRLTN